MTFFPIPSHSHWFIPIPIFRLSRELFPFTFHSHCLFPIPIPIPDYCKSVLTVLATLSITSLQRVQNAAASLVLNLDHWTHDDCAPTVTLVTSMLNNNQKIGNLSKFYLILLCLQLQSSIEFQLRQHKRHWPQPCKSIPGLEVARVYYGLMRAIYNY